MVYEKSEIEAKILVAGADRLYSSEIVDYTGYIKDSKERDTEFIAKYLIGHPDFFKSMKNSRRKKYKTEEHIRPVKFSKRPKTFINNRGNREEEWIAKEIFNEQFINGLGEVIDYQTPLKAPGAGKANLGLGKIDLLAFNDSELIILELKKPETDETLLRCVLEAYTYYCNIKGSLDILINKDNFNLASETKLKKAVFVFDGKDSRPYQEYIDNKNENTYVLQLMKNFNVDIYAIDEKVYIEQRKFIVRKL